MNKKLIAGLVLLIIVLVVGLELYIHRNFTKGPNLRTEAVARGDIESIIITSGTLSPVTLVPVGAQVSGKVAKIYADFNAKVRKGDILAEIDKAPFADVLKQREANYQSAQAEVEKARIALDIAKKESDRNVDLFDKGQISVEDKETAVDTYEAAKDDLLIAQAGLKQAQALLDQSRIDLNNCTIRAPMDGVVIYREINVGQTLASSMLAPELFKVANDIGKLLLDCDVDEADVGRVKEGLNVRFEVEAYPGQVFQGKVLQVRAGGETDSTGKVVTYHTLVDAENPEGKLLPGMTATATIITAEAKNVLYVTNSALKFEPALPAVSKKKAKKPAAKPFPKREGPRVWVQQADGSLTPVGVHTGVNGNTYTEIAGGELKEGDVVVLGLDYSKK
ncbi:MAG: efflux RND transporter periplasmic adaptor subunit [Candidatus Aminicenantales bacterium]